MSYSCLDVTNPCWNKILDSWQVKSSKSLNFCGWSIKEWIIHWRIWCLSLVIYMQDTYQGMSQGGRCNFKEHHKIFQPARHSSVLLTCDIRIKHKHIPTIIMKMSNIQKIQLKGIILVAISPFMHQKIPSTRVNILNSKLTVNWRGTEVVITWLIPS
jgi:hypothetical protein